MNRKALLCTAAGILAVAVACSKSTPTPLSPSATTQPDTAANADGSTLKATTPGTVSPTGGTQVTDPVTLTASKATGKFQDVPLSYQFQVRSGTTVVYDSGATGGVGSGSNVTHQAPASSLNPDTDYTWRVRAVYQGALGSWSSDASFKSPVGAFLRNGELRDPLTIGRTVGAAIGNVTFGSEGATINDQNSSIRYVMDQTVRAGEFSMLVKNIKTSAPGDKSKIMSMQEGFSDITTNRFRFTIEKRGSGYVSPGATTFRIITGNSQSRIFDGARVTLDYDVTHWYLWTASWRLGQARVRVVDTDTGKTRYDHTVSTGSAPREYEPNPMVAYVGSPTGRAGESDGSVPRIIVKNVWLGAGPRPTFPQ